jgi:hypothetical protein
MKVLRTKCCRYTVGIAVEPLLRLMVLPVHNPCLVVQCSHPPLVQSSAGVRPVRSSLNLSAPYVRANTGTGCIRPLGLVSGCFVHSVGTKSAHLREEMPYSRCPCSYKARTSPPRTAVRAAGRNWGACRRALPWFCWAGGPSSWQAHVPEVGNSLACSL